MSTKDDRRARFNPDPVAEVRSIPSPASSTSSLSPSPGPSTPPPLPNVAFSSPTHSPQVAMSSPYRSPPQPQVYTPSPIRQAYPLPYIPPTPLIADLYIHPAIASPSLRYDMRNQPSQTNLSPAILSHPASNPPLPSLAIRIGDLPWMFTVYPDPSVSPGNAVVIVQDVLLALYRHLRTTVKAEEYDRMSKPRKAEIFKQFELRVGADPVQRGKGLRRVDFLNGRFRAQGLVRAQSKDNIWNVVIN
ncbi:hypothetical protein BC827DRAFT_1133811 [Russula dissimulans]|nr:hypothetical protein BC827DRAFT_1133811 [Russula dissimulans]